MFKSISTKNCLTSTVSCKHVRLLVIFETLSLKCYLFDFKRKVATSANAIFKVRSKCNPVASAQSSYVHYQRLMRSTLFPVLLDPCLKSLISGLNAVVTSYFGHPGANFKIQGFVSLLDAIGELSSYLVLRLSTGVQNQIPFFST